MRRRIVLAVLGSVVVGLATAAVVVFVAPWRPVDASAERVAHSTSTSASTSTTLPARVGDRSPLVYFENTRPGSAGWQISKSTTGAIEGYATTVSIQPGEPVTLAVSTKDATFHVEAYRMGWYQGLGGRLVWQSPEQPGALQPKPVEDPVTNMDEARWQPSLTIATDASWVPGDYLLKLVGSSGNQQLVPLTVRSDASDSTFLVINAVTTWQAYNQWGGCSLYHCQGGGTRADVVSFDRPYALGEGASDFPGNELPLISRLEQWGLDVSYTTDVDVHRRPELLLQHRAILSMGHDEYWSKAMRDGMEAARDHGVNLAFFGANAAYRQIRFDVSPTGPERHEINYRSTDDPIRRQDPAQTTVSWREAPVNRPENTLIGQQYECNPVAADLVVSEASSWIYAGTGLTDGAHQPIVVGSEYDRWSPGPGVPPNVEILAHSPVTCGGRHSYADMTYYTAPSGAGVFAVGTNYWVSKHEQPGPNSPSNGVIMRITLNVLDAFGAGPAGIAHPSVANAAQIAGRGGAGAAQGAASAG